MAQVEGRNVKASASAKDAMAAGLYQHRTSLAEPRRSRPANAGWTDPVYSRREGTMRWTCAALLAIGTATAASGQVAWVGASWGASWEWQASSAPDTNFLHSSDGAPAVFVALPLDDDTFFRVKAAELPHIRVIDGVNWPGRFRGYTAGIDYLMTGTFGQSVFSAGLGSYRFEFKAKNSPAGYNDSKLGWYVGVGEWFPLSRRTRLTAEIAMNRTQHDEKPTIFTANVGLAFGL